MFGSNFFKRRFWEKICCGSNPFVSDKTEMPWHRSNIQLVLGFDQVVFALVFDSEKNTEDIWCCMVPQKRWHLCAQARPYFLTDETRNGYSRLITTGCELHILNF